jgi:hypothetical protein
MKVLVDQIRKSLSRERGKNSNAITSHLPNLHQKTFYSRNEQKATGEEMLRWRFTTNLYRPHPPLRCQPPAQIQARRRRIPPRSLRFRLLLLRRPLLHQLHLEITPPQETSTRQGERNRIGGVSQRRAATEPTVPGNSTLAWCSPAADSGLPQCLRCARRCFALGCPFGYWYPHAWHSAPSAPEHETTAPSVTSKEHKPDEFRVMRSGCSPWTAPPSLLCPPLSMAPLPRWSPALVLPPALGNGDEEEGGREGGE